MRFDFIDHRLVIETSAGESRRIALEPRSVASFYREFRDALRELGIDARIWKMPVEVPDPIAFDADETHCSYDPDAARRFWQILLRVVPIFEEFRGRFLGKSSPVHFFWGSFDLALTRFSGRRAPERPGADPITREAYSHEVVSAGFWPGGAGVDAPAFYVYAAPEPEGFSKAPIARRGLLPPGAEGVSLPYDAVRRGPDPRGALPRVPRVDLRCRRGPRRVGPQEPRALIRRLRFASGSAHVRGHRLAARPKGLDRAPDSLATLRLPQRESFRSVNFAKLGRVATRDCRGWTRA